MEGGFFGTGVMLVAKNHRMKRNQIAPWDFFFENGRKQKVVNKNGYNRKATLSRI